MTFCMGRPAGPCTCRRGGQLRVASCRRWRSVCCKNDFPRRRLSGNAPLGLSLFWRPSQKLGCLLRGCC